jgi:hypothetical protein
LKVDLHKLTTLFAVLIPLWGGMVFLWSYEKNLVKHGDLAVNTLDARLERAELLVTILSRNPRPDEEAKYERAKARLINLETQRDKLLGTNVD